MKLVTTKGKIFIAAASCHTYGVVIEARIKGGKVMHLTGIDQEALMEAMHIHRQSYDYQDLEFEIILSFDDALNFYSMERLMQRNHIAYTKWYSDEFITERVRELDNGLPFEQSA